MNRLSRLLAALLAALALRATPPVLIDVDEANPPFMYAVGSEARGVYPELLRAVFRRMGLPVEIRPTPWKRAMEELEAGQAGIGGLYKNEERLRKFDYSERLFQEKLVVYTNRRRPLAFSGPADLDGHRIGVLRGWSYGEAFDARRRADLVQVEEVASDEQNFLKLDALRVDAVLAVEEAGMALLPRFPDIQPSPVALLVNPTFLAFSKASPQRFLLPQFDKALRELRKNGDYTRIVAASLGK